MESNRTISLQKLFFLITLVSFILLVYLMIDLNNFKKNPISSETKQKLLIKEQDIQKRILKYYGLNVDIPVVLSKKINNKLFGLASFNGGNITIVLNKNRFFENENYMIDHVLPHEYAHALMFVLGDFSKSNGGHTLQWEKACLQLGGKSCNRFVKHDDVLFEKLDFIR
jgi:SprT protein